MKLLTFATLTLFYVGASKASAQVSNPTAPSDTIVVSDSIPTQKEEPTSDSIPAKDYSLISYNMANYLQRDTVITTDSVPNTDSIPKYERGIMIESSICNEAKSLAGVVNERFVLKGVQVGKGNMPIILFKDYDQALVEDLKQYNT